MNWIAFLVALALALVHLFAGKLRFLDVIPRSRYLSAASGTSVAYVFLHLLPELQEGQEIFEESGILDFVAHHIYLLALIGLATFYGLERFVSSQEYEETREQGSEAQHGSAIFWLHIISFSIYNLLIGYLLLHREESGWLNFVWYALAMILHFFVTDYGLRQDHRQAYRQRARWILAAAVLVGWLAGVLIELPELATLSLLSLLAGSVILNVLKEELPEERQSHFGSFAAGVVAYALLLLLL